MYKDDRKIRPCGPSLLQCHFRIENILWKILAEESTILEKLSSCLGIKYDTLKMYTFEFRCPHISPERYRIFLEDLMPLHSEPRYEDTKL